MRVQHSIKRVKYFEYVTSCGLHRTGKDESVLNNGRMCKRCWPQVHQPNLEKICCQCHDSDCSCGHAECHKCVLQTHQAIDGAILDVVMMMNNAGFRTTHSCAGYDYPGHEAGDLPQPYVAFLSDMADAYELSHKIEWPLKYDPRTPLIDGEIQWEIHAPIHGGSPDLVVPLWDRLREVLSGDEGVA